MNVKVSIVVPIYNAEKYLNRCIDSIRSQTLKDIEIILINDGSTDSSGDICEKLAKQDMRIKVSHKKNGGVGSARNLGIEKSKGKYIIFVDPDDYIKNDMVEKMYQTANKNNCDVVICNFVTNTKNRNEIKCIENKILYGETLKKYLIEYMISGECETYCWNKMYKRNIIVDNNIKFYNYNIWEDAIFNYEIMLRKPRVYYLTENLYYYIVNDKGLTQKYTDCKFNAAKTMLNKKKELINVYEIENINVHKQMYKCFIWDCISSIIQEKDRDNYKERLEIYINITSDLDVKACLNMNKKYIDKPFIYSKIEKYIRLNNMIKIDICVNYIAIVTKFRNIIKNIAVVKNAYDVLNKNSIR